MSLSCFFPAWRWNSISYKSNCWMTQWFVLAKCSGYSFNGRLYLIWSQQPGQSGPFCSVSCKVLAGLSDQVFGHLAVERGFILGTRKTSGSSEIFGLETPSHLWNTSSRPRNTFKSSGTGDNLRPGEHPRVWGTTLCLQNILGPGKTLGGRKHPRAPGRPLGPRDTLESRTP